MKKTIATISLAMVMGCGLALVHADDNMSNTTSDTHTTTTGDTGSVQQPGTVAGSNDTTTGSNDTMTAPDTSKSMDTTTKSTTTASKSKSCTDDSGKVLYKGQTGYKKCMKNMKEQMGGTADQSTTTETHKHTDSANPSDMGSTPSHDTSGSNATQ
jgi:hypothetical protein